MNNTLGFTIGILFTIFILWCLRWTQKWGEETRDDERRFKNAKQIHTPGRDGKFITIVRERGEVTKEVAK